MHLDLKILELKNYIKFLTLKFCVTARSNRNRYIRSSGVDLSAHNRRVSMRKARNCAPNISYSCYSLIIRF